MSEQGRERELDFCPRCFATSESGSWNHVIVSGYCMNCGNSSTVTLPLWAIESIREQASWVGKRHYPSKEDRQQCAELRALRLLVAEFPGRTAEPAGGDDPFRWWVKQSVAAADGGGWISVMVDASSAAEALDAARAILPYVPTPFCSVTA